jgi:glutamyl-tRNA reductase
LLLSVIGVNHKTAGLGERELFTLPEGEANVALARLAERKEVAECFLLATCNRTELYLLHSEEADPAELFAAIFPALHRDIINLCYRLENEEAVRHLFGVAAGLDSMVLGETEILGQLKEACRRGRAGGTRGTVLGSFCESALAAGKKVQSETGIGRSAVSYGYAAAVKAREMFGSLAGRTLMVIGTGKMAGLVLQNMLAFGIGTLLLAGRRRAS